MPDGRVPTLDTGSASARSFAGDANALTAAGASFSEAADPLAPHVVEDRELITGENPASAPAVGKALLARLSR